jgi:hypothetical protein
MAATLSPPRLLPSGDSAITVEFSRNIDDAANRRVLALDRAMAAEPVTGVTETVPTYRSLLVHYDPVLIDFDTLGESILALARRPFRSDTTRRWRIPGVYGGEHGIDPEDVASLPPRPTRSWRGTLPATIASHDRLYARLVLSQRAADPSHAAAANPRC